MTDAASWLVKPMRRHHALPHSFIIRRGMFTLQQACASTCPAARPLHAHSHSSLGPFSCIIQHARFLGFGPPTCSDPTFLRQRPGPLSARAAKRRNAKQGTAFKTAHEKNGLWIVRKHTPRTFGGALPYLMPSMPWSVACRPPPDRSSLNLPLRNTQFWERGGSHDPPRLTICSFPASVFASCSDGRICLPVSAGNVEHTTYVIYARSNGGAAYACLAGFDRAQPLCELGAYCSTGRAIPESQLTARAVIVITGILTQSCRLVSTIIKISFPQGRKIALCFTDQVQSTSRLTAHTR